MGIASLGTEIAAECTTREASTVWGSTVWEEGTVPAQQVVVETMRRADSKGVAVMRIESARVVPGSYAWQGSYAWRGSYAWQGSYASQGFCAV
jgi:hypothetical protein